MDLSTLQYYLTVCELGSITKAANKLYISRQAISKSISNLEKRIDAHLIIVKHDGIELTEEGQCMYKNALKLTAGWNKTVDEIESIKRAHKKTIHVGYGQMTYNLWDINHIDKFTATNPNIDIIAKVMLPDQLFKGLKERYLDVIITSANSEDKSLNTCTIKHLPLYVLMRVDDALSSKSYIGPKDLLDRNVYFIPNNQTFFNSFEKFMTQEKIKVNCKYCMDSTLPTILHTVRQNHGIYFTSGIFRRFLSFPDEFLMKQFIYDSCDSMLNKNINAITMQDSRHNTSIKCYVDYLHDAIKSV